MAAKSPEMKFKDKQGESVDDLLNQMKKVNINNDNEPVKIQIPPWLNNVESPFIWHSKMQRSLSSEHIIQRCLEKLEELSLDETDFSLRRYTVIFKLIIEYFISDNKERVDELIKIMKNCTKKDCAEHFKQYEKLKLVLEHVVFATEAHVLALGGLSEQSQKIANCITPISQMPNHAQAGFYAMKANFFLYSGYENGENVAVDFVRKALDFEPENEEWMYLLAKMLRQQRKEIAFNTEVPREELRLLEKAVEKCRSSKYVEYLAQVYMECATIAFKNYRTDPKFFRSPLCKTVEDMNKKALQYYKEALSISPDNPSNLRRIGYGIMNLPRQIADYDLAKQCLLKSLELCENTNTLHILGTFYHRYGNNNKKALEYYERTAKAGCHAGLSDMIRVRFFENPDYNPCEDIEEGLKNSMKKRDRMFLLSQQGGYYLFIKRDFLKSIKYFNQIILEDKDSLSMTVHKCIFLRMFDTINLYHYLTNEALLYLQQNGSSSNEEDDSIYEVMALLDTITNIYPELAEIEPDPLLITNLCDKSKEIIQKEKEKKDRYLQQGPKVIDNLQQGNQHFHSGNRRQGRGGSSGREAFDSSGEQRGNHEYSEQNRRGSYNRRGRGQNYQNRRGQTRSRADEDRNWRSKD